MERPTDVDMAFNTLFAVGAASEATALRAYIESLERDAARWQPIETADSNALALLYAPPEALFEEPAKRSGEFRVAAPRNWTWATHWMPLPAPPAIAQQRGEG
ncbi:MAG: hypothetical protein EKK62_04785 [Acidimicrobiia bacterium]|nr:MAG: hypothetical protein EKK62_04785 [Acidimicrobiia bacterium]